MDELLREFLRTTSHAKNIQQLMHIYNQFELEKLQETEAGGIAADNLFPRLESFFNEKFNLHTWSAKDLALLNLKFKDFDFNSIPKPKYIACEKQTPNNQDIMENVIYVSDQNSNISFVFLNDDEEIQRCTYTIDSATNNDLDNYLIKCYENGLSDSTKEISFEGTKANQLQEKLASLFLQKKLTLVRDSTEYCLQATAAVLQQNIAQQNLNKLQQAITEYNKLYSEPNQDIQSILTIINDKKINSVKKMNQCLTRFIEISESIAQDSLGVRFVIFVLADIFGAYKLAHKLENKWKKIEVQIDKISNLTAICNDDPVHSSRILEIINDQDKNLETKLTEIKALCKETLKTQIDDDLANFFQKVLAEVRSSPEQHRFFTKEIANLQQPSEQPKTPNPRRD